ncbi:hypothetical protein Gorai_000878 [Gossypium raimondii]|uniref:Uncharacterized protein n=1 Tax=Gossypium raimondii TaxID=29730 RepID=A0A7J8PF55_GOSRA|nr:hypothetical protein [Gossypium raimondii]
MVAPDEEDLCETFLGKVLNKFQETTTSVEYMPWFQHTEKPYLLSMEERSKQIRPRGHDDRLRIIGVFFVTPPSPVYYAPMTISMPTQMPTMEETRREARMEPHSTTEEGDEVEDEGRSEDEDNEYDEEEEPTPQLVLKNPTRNRQPPFCCTHLG